MINPNVVRRNLLDSMKRIDPTFNVDVLSKYEPTSGRFRSRPIPKASEFVDNGAEDRLQVIERLLKKSHFNQQPHWLVKWHGKTEEDASWEKEKNIRHVFHRKDLVADYTQRQ